MASQDLKKENEKLRAAHGETGGQPNYKWEFSENLYFPFRKEPATYDYVANQTTGLIEARPVFELKGMCPHLHRQWVLCRFIPPPNENTWKNTFGTKVDYPSKGYYAPTNVDLLEDVAPWDMNQGGESITDIIIGMANRDRNRTIEEWDAQSEAILAQRESARDSEMDAIIDNVSYIPFAEKAPHIPGSRNGSVSFGGV